MIDPKLEALELQLKQMNILKQQVLEYGVAIIGPSQNHGTFYTVGASWHGWPDLIMTDVTKRHAYYIMNVIIKHWQDHGYTEGRLSGIFANKADESMDMPIDFKLVEYNNELVKMVPLAAKFYATEPEFIHPVHKIMFAHVFPSDDNGKTQLEEGFDMRYHQTLVGTSKTVN